MSVPALVTVALMVSIISGPVAADERAVGTVPDGRQNASALAKKQDAQSSSKGHVAHRVPLKNYFSMNIYYVRTDY